MPFESASTDGSEIARIGELSAACRSETVNARERRAAVGRAQRDHRSAQRTLVAVVARDDDERAVRLHHRLGADEHAPARTGGDHVSPPSVENWLTVMFFWSSVYSR